MKFGSFALSFIQIALLSLGLNVAKADAEVTFPFEAIYNTETVFEPIQDNVFKSTVTGKSTVAPYGLTNFLRMNYIERNDNTGAESIVKDATEFGIEGLPILTETFFGNGDDKLFASTTGTAIRNVEDFTASISGTTTIVGGEGNFQGATGILTLSENVIFNLNATTEPRNTGIVVLSGSFMVPQKVPEARNTTILIGIGIISASLLLRQHRKIISK
ncbi:MAG: hypothetical protein KME50_30620 [Nostoc desertorum CM1-VF14]|jgi:hypothetical protein|nr:hypothetical protein [Nostoc desertorum CM1-VF14]